MYLKFILIQVILFNVVSINSFDIPEPIRKGIMELHTKCSKMNGFCIVTVHVQRS